MKELTAGKYVEKKSRFYTHIYKITDISDVNHILTLHRTMYKKANHHCYAYQIKGTAQQMIEKSNDDGEVGHPGRILSEVLKKHHLEQHMIVVSRIFGGIKLGVGGVSKAFKNAAETTIAYYQKHQ